MPRKSAKSKLRSKRRKRKSTIKRKNSESNDKVRKDNNAQNKKDTCMVKDRSESNPPSAVAKVMDETRQNGKQNNVQEEAKIEEECITTMKTQSNTSEILKTISSKVLEETPAITIIAPKVLEKEQTMKTEQQLKHESKNDSVVKPLPKKKKKNSFHGKKYSKYLTKNQETLSKTKNEK
eukprot:33917_1